MQEVKLTEEEFERGVDFLVRIGQASGPEKNEAILLSDLLGVSTLVVMLNNARAAARPIPRCSARSGAAIRRCAKPATTSRAMPAAAASRSR